MKYAAALVPHTSALHLAVELDGVKHGDIVSCSNLTFSATVSPAFYESGNQVFIDSEHEMRDMDPCVLDKAFT